MGVKRQYCGASGKIDNCQVGVFLSWQTAKGHALIDRALYLPEEWAEDEERRRAAGVPEAVEFATKPALARRMVTRALATGTRPAWVVADAVYGADYKLRSALEEARQPYVLAVTGQQCVWMGFGQQRVKTVKTQVPADAWAEISVAAGTKGPRVFDWAALRINHPHGKEWQRFLLLRRSRSKAGEITAYLVFGPADTSLEEMARIAGRRWAIEESFAQSKGEVIFPRFGGQAGRRAYRKNRLYAQNPSHLRRRFSPECRRSSPEQRTPPQASGRRAGDVRELPAHLA